MPVLEHQHIDFCALGKGPDPGLPLSTVRRALDKGGAGGRLRPSPSPAGQGRHLEAYSGTRDPWGSSPGWSAPGLLRTSRRRASLLGWCLEL